MKRCPISYEAVTGRGDYAARGLAILDRTLPALARLEFTADQLRAEAVRRPAKMSVQGVQLKLSAVLRVTAGRFAMVDEGGRFILKPPSVDFAQVPENEDVTMRMAKAAGIEVPVCGLLRAMDGSLTYFIKRFDRRGRGRLPMEDFAQLTGASRDTKYDSSMEKVAGVVDAFCTFPALERIKLFERVLFSFLVGNEDMHLKNFSLLTRDGKVGLAPGYDFLNTTIALKNPREEMALPIRGKKSKLSRRDLVDYFARERLRINEKGLADVLDRFEKASVVWRGLLQQSFLSAETKSRYWALVVERLARLRLNSGAPAL